MVPPPSAEMQPARNPPPQSILRRPAASAAVIACAASATRDSQCSTKSLVGSTHIDSLSPAKQGILRVPSQAVHRHRAGSPEHPPLPEVVLRPKEEPIMAYQPTD